MVKVLVVGATGYLGLSVAQALRRSSATVYGLARSTEKAALLASHEIIPVLGSLEEPAGFFALIESENIDVVIDTSAVYQGAQTILHGALRIGKARQSQGDGGRLPKLSYIYCSGLWVHGDSKKPVNDLSLVGLPNSSGQPPKMLSWRPGLEREILAASDVLNVAIVRPALMYGKNQSAFGSYFGPIQQAAKGATANLKIAASSEVMLPLVHVDDCAEGICRVVEKIEIVSHMSLYPVFDLTGSIENMGIVLKQAAQILRFEGELDFVGPGDDLLAQALCTSVNSDSSRAKALLGWAPRKKGLLQEIEIHVKAFLGSQGIVH